MTLIQRRLVGLCVFVVVGALGGFIALWQQRHSELKDQEKKAAEKVLRFDKPELITKLTLDTPAGSFVVQREPNAPEEETWKVKAPLDTVAEKTTVDGILGHLSTLARTRAVGETAPDGTVMPPAELGVFGLDPPRFTVTVEANDGAIEKLLVGKKSTFDGSVFVKVDGKPEVGVVPGALEYQVDRDLFKLREKRLAIIDSAQVNRLTVTYVDPAQKRQQHYVLEKDGEEFAFKEPKVMPADSAQVSGILSSLGSARAKRFVSERATRAEMHTFKLDEPSAQVEMSLANGSTVTLLYSEMKNAESTSYYAMQAGDHPLLELSSEWAFKKAMTSPDDLRDKRVLRIDREAVRTLTLTQGATELRFERRADAKTKELGWSMVAPEARAVSEATLSGLLYTLSSLKGERVIADSAIDADWATYGLDKPEIRVTLAGEADAPLGTLLVGVEKDGGRAVSSAGSRRIDIVDGSRIKDISFNPDDYKDVHSKDEP